MYTGFKHLHSFTAYLTLAFLIIAVGYGLYSWLGSKPFSKSSHTIRLLALIGIHTQLLFGVVLYFVSPLGLANFSGAAMKDSNFRLYMLEHPLTMIIATVLITIGYSKSKKASDDKSKFKLMTIYFGIGLFLVLLRIPWSAWLAA